MLRCSTCISQCAKVGDKKQPFVMITTTVLALLGTLFKTTISRQSKRILHDQIQAYGQNSYSSALQVWDGFWPSVDVAEVWAWCCQPWASSLGSSLERCHKRKQYQKTRRVEDHTHKHDTVPTMQLSGWMCTSCVMIAVLPICSL